jgi:hypothetical protein
VRFLVAALLSGVPASLVSILLLWSGKHTSLLRWLLTGLVVAFWIGSALYLRSYLVYPQRTPCAWQEVLGHLDEERHSSAERHHAILRVWLLNARTKGGHTQPSLLRTKAEG